MPFDITLSIDLGDDTENDFFNEIVAQNEGEAIQTLAQGKATNFANVTAQQKKDFVLERLAQQFANIYFNSKDERTLQALRTQLQDARKGGKK